MSDRGKRLRRVLREGLSFTFILAGILLLLHYAWVSKVPDNILLSIFQSLIQIDGIILGFIGVVFGGLLVRKEVRLTKWMLMAVLTILVLFTVSISASLYDMENIGQGLSGNAIEYPLDLTFSGLFVFFFTIAEYFVD